MLKADLIIYNAKVYTVNTFFDMATAFAVKNGKFIAVGSDADIKNGYTATENIDAGGTFILPGLIDPHCHLFWYGYGKLQADLRNTISADSAIPILKEHQRSINHEWLLGKGWDHQKWDVKEFPDKDILDTFFDMPVYLERVDTHAAWVNTKALEIAGITEHTEVEGGKVIVENGQLTGILIDKAMDLVKRFIPPFTREDKIRALMLAQQDCIAAGLTSIGDAYLYKHDVELLQQLHEEEQLKLRIYAMLVPDQTNKEHFFRTGPVQSEMMNIRSFKFFADGTMGSRSAYLFDDYVDDPGNKGIYILDEEDFADTASHAIEKGFQINTHCIGDRALHKVLKLYGEFLKEKNDRRWRIEHAQLVQPEDLKLFSDFSIIPSIQTTHAISDMPWIETRIGAKGMANAYPYRRLLDTTGIVANGSDFPVETVDPLMGFYTAVARKNKEGNPEEGFLISEKLTREQALKAMTIWAAYANFEEHLKGSIAPGKLADFVILNKDIMKIPEQELLSVQVLQTFINGVELKTT